MANSLKGRITQQCYDALLKWQPQTDNDGWPIIKFGISEPAPNTLMLSIKTQQGGLRFYEVKIKEVY